MFFKLLPTYIIHHPEDKKVFCIVFPLPARLDVPGMRDDAKILIQQIIPFFLVRGNLYFHLSTKK